LLKLPNQLVIDTWNKSSVIYYRLGRNESLTFYLTRAIIDMFKTNIDFISNWNNLNNSDTNIENYIRNNVLSYYNLNPNKIEIEFYRKQNTGQPIFYTYDNEFILDTKKNFIGDLNTQINNEYYYIIKTPVTANYSYYAKFIITEK
jgi:hypothetical protein